MFHKNHRSNKCGWCVAQCALCTPYGRTKATTVTWYTVKVPPHGEAGSAGDETLWTNVYPQSFPMGNQGQDEHTMLRSGTLGRIRRSQLDTAPAWDRDLTGPEATMIETSGLARGRGGGNIRVKYSFSS